MGRIVMVEEKAHKYLEDLSSTKFAFGLILGQPQVSAQRDHVIHLVKTTFHQKEDENEEQGEEEKEKKSKPKKEITKLEDVEEKWVIEHANHATMMLPGGMWVLGIFTVSPGDLLQDNGSQSKIRSILLAVKNSCLKNQYFHGDAPCSEKLALHMCNQSKRYVCKTVEVDNPAASLKPADWRVVDTPMKWHRLECTFSLDLVVPVFQDDVKNYFKKQLQGSLTILNRRLEKAVCLFEGKSLRDSDLLVSDGKEESGKGKKKGRSGESDVTPSRLFNVDLLVTEDPENEDVKKEEYAGRMTHLGQLWSRTYVHQKATVAEAANAVKQDIVRSLAARFDLHSHTLIDEDPDTDEDIHILHEPPRRVMVPLRTCPIWVSDYLFPGEGPSDCLDSVRDTLDIKVTEADLDDTYELQADPSDLRVSSEPQGSESPSMEDLILPSRGEKHCNPLYIGIAMFIAVIAICIAYTIAISSKKKK